jgi:hypothetical protein
MKLPAFKLADKVQAGGIGSAAAILLVWVGQKRGWDISPEVAMAMVSMGAFVASYLTTERAYQKTGR